MDMTTLEKIMSEINDILPHSEAGLADEIEPVIKKYLEYGELKQSPRELLERTWEAAATWKLIQTDIEDRAKEGSRHWTNPCSDKETFINSILSESPKDEAVEFAEWAVTNYDWHFVYWSSRKNPLNGEFSTSQLYTLFKQTKEG